LRSGYQVGYARLGPWLSVAPYVAVVALLVSFCAWGPIKAAIVDDAYRAGTLESHPAVVKVKYVSGLDGSDRGGGVWTTSRNITVILSADAGGSGGGRRYSLYDSARLDVRDGQAVEARTWGGDLVAVNSTYVYREWSAGLLIAYLLLPVSVVLAVRRVRRILRSRTPAHSA
jgi:hypothetical protein